MDDILYYFFYHFSLPKCHRLCVCGITVNTLQGEIHLGNKCFFFTWKCYKAWQLHTHRCWSSSLFFVSRVTRQCSQECSTSLNKISITFTLRLDHFLLMVNGACALCSCLLLISLYKYIYILFHISTSSWWTYIWCSQAPAICLPLL